MILEFDGYPFRHRPPEFDLKLRPDRSGKDLPEDSPEHFRPGQSVDHFRLLVHIEDSPVPVIPHESVRDAFEHRGDLLLDVPVLGLGPPVLRLF